MPLGLAYNPLMLRRRSSFLVAIALALPLGPGCSKKQQLTEVAVPEAGVSLRYDVTPGQQYSGHVKMRNAAQTPLGEVVTKIEFDATLLVSADQVGDAMQIQARVDGIDLSLRLPDGVPAQMAGGMTPEAAASLNGTQMAFTLNESGEIDGVTEPPASLSPEVQGIHGMLSTALTAGFAVRMPPQPIKDAQSWDAKSSKAKGTIISASNTGNLEGMGRNEAGDEIAQLAYAGQIESERAQGDQTFQVNQKFDSTVSFAVAAGYPIQMERSINMQVVGGPTILTEIGAQWSKGATQAVTPSAGTQVQEITDPCDPDYVGAAECAEDAAPAPAADPAAAPAADPAAQTE